MATKPAVPVQEDLEVAKCLHNWMNGDDEDPASDVDAVLEFLGDHSLLNAKGKKLAHAYWWHYLSEYGHESRKVQK